MNKLWNWIYLNTGIGFLISAWEVHSGKVIVDEITYPLLLPAPTGGSACTPVPGQAGTGAQAGDRPSPNTERKWRFL